MQKIKETVLEVGSAILPVTVVKTLLKFTLIGLPVEVFMKFLIGQTFCFRQLRTGYHGSGAAPSAGKRDCLYPPGGAGVRHQPWVEPGDPGKTFKTPPLRFSFYSRW
ncbi:MAG: hypothetical protein BAA01_05745 [Bacillus thermozeamaize]|uniref:Uncharacterized protein n=1 Tax=Bacillus thermozeamaize TaxID=230954 RepID=A0A1Y3PBC5_9BACI|nr:MAG: hypothetical protein BAA01_05745 [Bacillus thermozeamaize]